MSPVFTCEWTENVIYVVVDDCYVIQTDARIIKQDDSPVKSFLTV